MSEQICNDCNKYFICNECQKCESLCSHSCDECGEYMSFCKCDERRARLLAAIAASGESPQEHRRELMLSERALLFMSALKRASDYALKVRTASKRAHLATMSTQALSYIHDSGESGESELAFARSIASAFAKYSESLCKRALSESLEARDLINDEHESERVLAVLSALNRRERLESYRSARESALELAASASESIKAARASAASKSNRALIHNIEASESAINSAFTLLQSASSCLFIIDYYRTQESLERDDSKRRARVFKQARELSEMRASIGALKVRYIDILEAMGESKCLESGELLGESLCECEHFCSSLMS